MEKVTQGQSSVIDGYINIMGLEVNIRRHT